MTRVALLWHMHQPFYQDLATGEHVLPWVRLHGLKDYWGMVALLREFPGVRLTFNLVPSLLVQIEAFARGEAQDRHLDVGLRSADQLSEEDRAFCVEQFFHAQRERMIDPHPRYAELLARRTVGSALSAKAQASLFSVDDLRDLQVWHKLAWVDPIYFDADPRVRSLVDKGYGYSEADKQVLREVELELLGRIIPEYRDAAGRGQIELSTSPFYHPILPLLCDSDVHLRAHPHSRLPRTRFQHPEDAMDQVTRAVTLHERLFGQRPSGLWPSEGSVSDAMLPIVAAAGFTWLATDEGILSRTLDELGHEPTGRPERLYRPYRVGPDGALRMAFRDHALSDLIGFSYAAWDADTAARDFVNRVAEAGADYTQRTGGEATVFVILDGENAWEHFDRQGRPFLRALYGHLDQDSRLRTVTMTEACAPATERLPSIFPGSWINSDFYIWIGHADDHRAWSQLADARQAIEGSSPRLTEASRAMAREELLIAEGSDWFWWYGDDHSSEHDLVFDDLFRRHVRNVYKALGQPIPEELFVTNITTRPPAAAIHPPTGFIEPVIDGEVTSYFEWIGAGSVEVDASGGAMHRVSNAPVGLTLVEFGFNLDALFIRLDAGQPMRALLDHGFDFHISFLEPAGTRVRIEGHPHTVVHASIAGPGAQPERSGRASGVEAAAGRILEVRIPFGALGLVPHAPLAFIVAMNRRMADGAFEVQHHPRHRAIEIQVPDASFAAHNWTA